MDRPTTPTTQRVRPGMGRSQSALPQISPLRSGPDEQQQQQQSSLAQAAARKLHILPGHRRLDSSRSKPSNSTTNLSTINEPELEPAIESAAAVKHKKHHKHHHHGSRSTVKQTGHAIADLAKSAAPATGSGSKGSSGDSNKQSQQQALGAEADGVATALRQGQMSAMQHPVKPSYVLVERRRRERRESELRRELGGLQKLATDSTRELDEAYYGILEKAVSLRELLDGLQELSGRAHALQRGFQGDSEELEREIRKQVDAISSFRAQQVQIDDLESRVTKGRERAKGLSERLEAARNRVEVWGQREAEWQAQTSKRIQIGWGLVGAALTVLLVLLVAKATVTPRDQADERGVDRARVLGPIRGLFRALFEAGLRRQPEPMVEDPRLRIFDEL